MIGTADSWEISYKRRDEAEVRLWIVPSRGNSLIRAEIHVRRGAETLVDRMVNDLQEGANGVWFPAMVSWSREIDGKVGMEETTKITAAQFNVPIDPATFTLAGLQFPRGAMVRDYRSRPPRETLWNGTALIANRPAREEPAPVVVTRGFNVWLVLAVSFALLALVLSVLYWRRRQPN